MGVCLLKIGSGLIRASNERLMSLIAEDTNLGE